MLHETVVYEADPDYPFNIVAKRYWIPAFEAEATDPDALTLIFLHSTSFHKETWEPTLSHLFDLVANSSRRVKVREAWALDCPNHGEAAQLNEEVLKRLEYRQNCMCGPSLISYGLRALTLIILRRFLSAGPQNGAKIDFRARNLVGIGHSLGGVAMSALQGITPPLPFSSIIIIEPMLSPDGRHHLARLRKQLLKSAWGRRDVWPDRDAAKQYLQERMKRSGRQAWDPRVVELFLKYGIRPHPGSTWEASYQGVTLACTREEEVGMYLDVEGPTRPVKALNGACARMPVHIAFGSISDYIPREVHDATVDPRSGRKFASITMIEGVGHLVPQIVPEKLANVIFSALLDNAKPKPKL